MKVIIFPSQVLLITIHLDPTEGEDLRGAGLLHGVQGVGVHLPRGLVSRRGADYIFHLIFLLNYFVTFFSLLLLPPLPWPHLPSSPRPLCIRTDLRARNSQLSPREQLLNNSYKKNFTRASELTLFRQLSRCRGPPPSQSSWLASPWQT